MTTTTKKQATALFAMLRKHFVDAQAVIEEIIAKRAWEPLGFNNFTEAWRATMGDVTLLTEVRPFVVYQMFADGASEDEVAFAVKGVGRDRAAYLDRQRRNGIPAANASMYVVNGHLRRRPRPADTIHVRVGSSSLEQYHDIAARLGQSLESIAMDAIARRFDELRSEVMTNG